MTPDDHARITEAVQVWTEEKEAQAQRSRVSGRAQEGSRSQVTGGRHLRGVNKLIVEEIQATGATGLDLKVNRQAVLAGWYRSSKQSRG